VERVWIPFHVLLEQRQVLDARAAIAVVRAHGERLDGLVGFIQRHVRTADVRVGIALDGVITRRGHDLLHARDRSPVIAGDKLRDGPVEFPLLVDAL
jgi:hypothetical protein